jgi:hypothetical protein
VKQQHTLTATPILTTKTTYRSLSAQRLSERTVFYGPQRFTAVFTRDSLCPYRMPDSSSLSPLFLFKIQLNTFPSALKSSKWFLSPRFPHQIPACTFPLPHTCYMSRPFILPCFVTLMVYYVEKRSSSPPLPVTVSFLDQISSS